MGNIFAKKNKDNDFPHGTKYEEELNSNFKYFNVFWYDPNKSNDFDCFSKCFENVKFLKGYDLETTINFFKKENVSEWIVITPGSKGEELIQNLEEFQCIQTFFIYCWNTELHEKWANKRKKVGCITSSPEILCQKFIELNKKYIIPNFKYKDIKSNDFEINLNEIKTKNKFALNAVKISLNSILETVDNLKSKYNNFCIKSLHYLNGDKYKNDFKEPVEENPHLYFYAKMLQKSGDEKSFESIVNYIKNLTLLSLYFSQNKYLFNLLSFNEVKDLVKNAITFSDFEGGMEKILFSIEKLSEKIMKNESILDEKDALKELQIYSILFSFKNIYESIKVVNINMINFYQNYLNSYQIINLLRDLDFSLKILVFYTYTGFNNKNHNFIDELFSALISGEIRFDFWLGYEKAMNKMHIQLKEEDQKKIDDSLTIKDFIIVGNQTFINKIKTIENDIKANSIKYLQIEQIYNYINEKNDNDNKKANDKNQLVFFYYLIIKLEEFQENIGRILLLSSEFGITFIVLLYIENEDCNIIFHKNYINYMISIILVYSPEDIIKYLSQKLYFLELKYNIEELKDISNIKIPKITFEQRDEEKYQDGCFELSETFDTNLVKNKFLINYFGVLDIGSEISPNLYQIYKDHNALDLLFKKNSIYFLRPLNVETVFLDICFVKRILYLYCREEVESEKSFYRMINDDLRKREPSKIYRNINLLALINQLIESEQLSSYKGKVYRATKLDEKLILKLVPGTKMVNTTFWSTTKDFNIAERFMKNNKWRNSYIICNNIKTNIDIDSEKLNPYGEKEILFLPFTEFRVEKISIENKYEKKIYKIELSELGNRNFVNYDNMQIENVKNFSVKVIGEKILSKIKENEKNP